MKLAYVGSDSAPVVPITDDSSTNNLVWVAETGKAKLISVRKGRGRGRGEEKKRKRGERRGEKKKRRRIEADILRRIDHHTREPTMRCLTRRRVNCACQSSVERERSWEC